MFRLLKTPGMKENGSILKRTRLGGGGGRKWGTAVEKLRGELTGRNLRLGGPKTQFMEGKSGEKLVASFVIKGAKSQEEAEKGNH